MPLAGIDQGNHCKCGSNASLVSAAPYALPAQACQSAQWPCTGVCCGPNAHKPCGKGACTGQPAEHCGGNGALLVYTYTCSGPHADDRSATEQLRLKHDDGDGDEHQNAQRLPTPPPLAARLRLRQLKVEYAVRPLAVDVPSPMFSWVRTPPFSATNQQSSFSFHSLICVSRNDCFHSKLRQRVVCIRRRLNIQNVALSRAVSRSPCGSEGANTSSLLLHSVYACAECLSCQTI